MDAFQQRFAFHADRPLLGAFAVAACLAGGTATQNHAGIPRGVDGIRFAAGWNAGAPQQPDQTITALTAALAPSIAAPKGSKRPVPAINPPAPRLTVKPWAETPRAPASVPKAPIAAPVALAMPAAAPSVPDLSPAAVSLAEGAVPTVAVAELVTVQKVTAVAPGAVAKPLEPADVAEAPLALVTSPELRRFDLAKFNKAAPRPAKFAASRKSAPAAAAKAKTPDRLIDGVVYHHASVEVAGQSGGEIAVRIGPDMKPSVKLADLLGLVSAQMDPDTLARFQLASSAGDYVSFAALRSAGFDVKYNAAADSIAISVAP